MFLVNHMLLTINFGSKWEYGWNVIGHVVNCWAGWWGHRGSLYFSLQFWICLREFPQSNIKYNLTALSAVGILQGGAVHLSPSFIAAWTQALWIKLCFFLLCFWRALLPQNNGGYSRCLCCQVTLSVSDDTTLLPMSQLAGRATVWCSQARTLRPDWVSPLPLSLTSCIPSTSHLTSPSLSFTAQEVGHQ